MIRIDYKPDGNGHVQTTWVLEDGDKHSIMGRLLFFEEEFDALREVITMTHETQFDYKFEEKK